MTAILLAAEEEPSPILPHTSEIILGLIAFALVLWVLWKIGRAHV